MAERYRGSSLDVVVLHWVVPGHGLLAGHGFLGETELGYAVALLTLSVRHSDKTKLFALRPIFTGGFPG